MKELQAGVSGLVWPNHPLTLVSILPSYTLTKLRRHRLNPRPRSGLIPPR